MRTGIGKLGGVHTAALPNTSPKIKYGAGLYRVQYSGWYNNVPSFFNAASTVGSPVLTTNFELSLTSSQTNQSYQWVGYFKPDYTGTWTIGSNGTGIDDSCTVWIGSNAHVGYTTSNSLINVSGLAAASSTISLSAGVYYPIRVQYGNSGGPGVMTLSYAHTGRTVTNNWSGLLFNIPSDTTFVPFIVTEHIDTNGASIVDTNTGPELTIITKSTSYQVNPHEQGYIVVNGTNIKTTDYGSRGHTLAVLAPTGAVVGSIVTYDTFGNPTDLANITTALNAVASGNYIVLVSWDACAVDSNMRTSLTNNYGATQSTTWAPTRYSHTFIGRRI